MNTVPNDCRRWREALRLETDDAAQLERHLAACPECRDYARSLHATSAALRWLAHQPAQPSPALRARWTAAIHAETQPPAWRRTAERLCQWWGLFLAHNRRPLFALAPVWLLIVLLRWSAPPVEPVHASAVLASSPAKVLRQFQAQRQLLAQELGHPLPAPQRPAPSPARAPRSEAAPSPAALHPA